MKLPRPSIKNDQHRLLLGGLAGLVTVGLLFVVAIGVVAQLEPTTGPAPEPTEAIATPTP